MAFPRDLQKDLALSSWNITGQTPSRTAKAPRGLPVQEAYLFGSRARGDWLNESDVDVILVSESFASQEFYQRMVDVSRHWDGPEALEALCYTPAEFSNKKSRLNIISDAMSYAVRIPT